MRAFIAIEINDEVRKKLVEIQEKIDRTKSAKIKFVEPENLHITLKFLGEITEEQAEDIKRILESIAKKRKKHEVDAKGIGVFPNYNYVRVIWAGVDNDEEIKKMAEEIDNALFKLGFKREKNFVSHITIGRVKFVKDKVGLMLALKELSNEEFGKFKVEAIELKKSTLTPKGPIYETLARFELQD
ncbi:MAG TPA: RNA 2',3'-cyclic phosphodiesterase [Thermococcaceae archaeon]|uniref:RNA 2',3'-cyclic phosphodiesterase n=1 Tax=Thermococcus sibiricus TaxID=172049 RepID=A0A101ENF9_9EURY|nr:RNA 2',3'-cyclic phosphodiesterase [Thermococcus sibiricus]KUK18165.1 MAG: 2'-5' RNA ligase [Thermococcus sibiricus]KUK29207.1 MAG: 2'-5' RNA ligase [Thermococcus sp. 40_45]HII68105.1 RNA 2',3'-cyclic phosphodiesterase [Thermococcaceae archaeon]